MAARRCERVVRRVRFAAGGRDLKLRLVERVPGAFWVVVVQRDDRLLERDLGFVQLALDVTDRAANVLLLLIR